jgi:hypothetical protein
MRDMIKYKPGDRVWIVPYRPPDGGLSTGVVVPLPAGYRPNISHLSELINAPAIFAVRLDEFGGDPRLFLEIDLRPVGQV